MTERKRRDRSAEATLSQRQREINSFFRPDATDLKPSISTFLDAEISQSMHVARTSFYNILSIHKIPVPQIIGNMGIDPQRVIDFTKYGRPINLTWLIHAVEKQLPPIINDRSLPQ